MKELNLKTTLASSVGLDIDTVKTGIATVAKVAYGAVLGVVNIGLGLMAKILPSVAGGLSATTAGAVKGATGMTALGVSIGTVLTTLGLVVGAFVALKAAADSYGAGKAEADKTRALAEEFRLMTEEMTGVQEETLKTESYFDRLGKQFEKGWVNGIQAGLVDLQSALFGTADATDKYGDELRLLGIPLIYITKEQLAFQRSVLATEELVNRVGNQFDAGIDLITKYGVAVVDSTTKLKLGEEAIASFTEEAQKQIDVNQKQIDGIKAQNPPMRNRHKCLILRYYS
jgi:hypothetical protein